jgi:hypothetical protein
VSTQAIYDVLHACTETGVVGVAPCLDPSDSAGYVVDEAEVVFWGLCPGCSR